MMTPQVLVPVLLSEASATYRAVQLISEDDSVKVLPALLIAVYIWYIGHWNNLSYLLAFTTTSLLVVPF